MSAQEDFGALTGFVEWLGLEGEEAEAFVKEAMTRRGHKPATTWTDGDGKQDKGGNNVLGLRSSSGQRKASGSGWQYGG